jgi:hypothetical protein
MERFCSSLADEEISEVLLEKIRGKGAFHRFKQAIDHYGIEQDWFKFESAAYKEIAIAWLDEHRLAYKDDL